MQATALSKVLECHLKKSPKKLLKKMQQSCHLIFAWQGVTDIVRYVNDILLTEIICSAL